MLGENVIEKIRSINMVIENNNYFYSTFSIVAPFSIAYIISPEFFPKNHIYSLCFLLFYTLLFHFIYRLYSNAQISIKAKIRKNVAPKVIDKTEDYEIIYEEMLKAKNNPYFPEILNKIYIQRMEKFLNQIENAKKGLNVLNSYGKQLHPKMDVKQYKKFDYILLFTGSTLVSTKYFFDFKEINSSYIELLDSYTFALFFALTIVVYILYEYMEYLRLIVYAKILFLLTPLVIHFLSVSNEKVIPKNKGNL